MTISQREQNKNKSKLKDTENSLVERKLVGGGLNWTRESTA